MSKEATTPDWLQDFFMLYPEDREMWNRARDAYSRAMSKEDVAAGAQHVSRDVLKKKKLAARGDVR
jgi:hypothetical protein